MNLTPITQAVLTTSTELLTIINEARLEYGEKEVRRNDFISRVKDELDGEHYESFVVKNPNGTESEEIRMTDDQCAFVSMRESKAVRRRVTKRLNDLRTPAFNPSSLTRIDILKLAMEAEEGRIKAEAKVLALTHAIEDQKPAVEFVDRFVEAKSAKGFREVAKILGIKEREFIADLAADKIIFKQGSNWLPMADHQHAGRFTVKTGEANGHAFIQTRFTPEGIAWVAKRLTNSNTAGGLTF